MTGPGARLRWLVLATHVPPSGGGGMARVASELCRELARDPRIELHALVRPDAAGFFEHELGVPAPQLHAGPAAGTVVQSLKELTGLGLPVDLASFDVVHGTKHIVPIRGTGRATTALTVHDLIVIDRPGDFPVAKRSLLRVPYVLSLRRAQVLVAVSEASRRRLVAFAPKLADRASAAPLAVSRTLLDGTPTPVPALVDRPFALVVGDLSARKNVRFVTRLWPEVLAQVPGAVLAIVGPPGWGRDEGREEIGALEAQGSATHLGHVSDGELRWAYEHAAVTLCPSLLEGFGLPAAEARAFGCPVITSADPALQEAAGDGTTVPLERPAQWVSEIVARLGAEPGAERRPGARRTWEQVADELVGAVVARRGAPPAAHPRSIR